MATLYYDNYYNAYVAATPGNAPVNETGGRVRAASATLTDTTVLTSAGTADTQPGTGDIIYLARIPAKAKIHFVLFKTSAAWGTTATFAVSMLVGSTTTVLVEAGLLNTANATVFATATTNSNIENAFTETSGEAIIHLTIAAADITLTSSNNLEVTVFYSVD